MSYVEHVKRDGPQAYWLLDDSSGPFVDETGNGNSASISGDVTLQTASIIQSNSSATFNTEDSHADVGTVVPMTSSDDWSAAAWIKTAVTGRDNYFIGTNAGTGAYMRVDSSSGGALLVKVDDGSNDAFGAGTITINDDTPHYCVMVKVGGRLKGYVDGNLDIDLDASAVGDLDEHWFFGAAVSTSGTGSGTTSYSYVGVLDEPALFGYALTPQQIRRHYWAGKGYTGYALEVLASGPGIYYRLEESDLANPATDESSNGLDGTYQNTSSLKAGASPIIRNGTSVGFSGGWVEIPQNSQMKNLTAFSVEAWVVPRFAAGDGNRHNIARAWNPNSAGMFFLLDVESGDTLRFAITGSNAVVISSAWSKPSGSINHVAAYYDGAELRLYLNGTLVASTSASRTLPDRTDVSHIGAQDSSGAAPWDGRIDEVAFYPFAISEQEIRRHYELGLAENSYRIEVLSSLPWAYWKLDETSGSTAVDEKGNNDGSWANGSNITAGASSLVSDGGSSYHLNPDDTDDAYVTLGSIVPMTSSDDWTAEVWFQTSQTQGTSLPMIIGSGNDNGAYIAITRDQNNVGLNIKIDDGSNQANDKLSGPFNDGTVYHVVMKREGSRFVAFLNGDKKFDLDASSVGGLLENWYLGEDPENGDNIYRGKVDEPAVYGRALSDAEIIRHYYVGKFGPVLGTILFIAGVVTDESDGSALDATVRAYRWSDGALLQTTTSDPSTGEYRIEEIEDSELLVVMQPPSGLRPLAHGPVKPAEG